MGARKWRLASGRAEVLVPIFLLALVGGYVAAGYRTQSSLADPNSPAVVAGLTAAQIWLRLGLTCVMFFVITSPVVMVGMQIASKLMKFELSSGTYGRAAAVAAVPIVAGLCATLFQPPLGVVLALFLGGPILAIFISALLFETTALQTVVATVICGPLFVVAVLVGGLLVVAITLPADTKPAAAQQASAPQYPGTGRGNAAPRVSAAPVNTGPPADPIQARMDALTARIESLSGSNMNTQTREQLRDRLASIQVELDALQPARGTTSQWLRISEQARGLDAQAARLPSEKPDESLFTPMTSLQDWPAKPLSAASDDISFGPLNLRVPADARLDLKTSNTTTLSWSWKGTWTSLTLSRSAATDPRQVRPWIVPRRVLQVQVTSPNLFVIETERTASIAGSLAGATFFRVETSGGSNSDIIYAGRIGDGWMKAVISGVGAEARAAFESAIMTLRSRAQSEPVIDPLSPRMLVKRLEDAPADAAVLLKSQGPAAEEAVLEALSGSPQLQRRALDVLADVATERSLPAVESLVNSSDSTLSKSAAAVLKRLKPGDYDDTAMAALTLKRGSTMEIRAALDKLASVPRDPQRPQITRDLEQYVLSESLANRQQAARALAVWADEQTVPKLLPWLDQNANTFKRETAFVVLPATRDPRVVLPLLRWVVKEPEDVAKAVITVGPAAEDEVIRQLFQNIENNRNVEARRAGAQILQEIGTTKSILILQRASTDPRDATAAQIAKGALEVVRQRVQAARGSTTAPRGR